MTPETTTEGNVSGESLARRTVLKLVAGFSPGLAGCLGTQRQTSSLSAASRPSQSDGTPPDSKAESGPGRESRTELRHCDLNGRWIDNGSEVTITDNGVQVTSEWIEPRTCDYRDGSGQSESYEHNFTASRTGDHQLEGETSVCYWGEDNPCGLGVDMAPIQLTIGEDCNELSGTWYDCVDEVDRPITIIRLRGPGDVDGDGIINEADPDMDGDGIPNWQDPDMDGDGAPNVGDPDMDGDGLPNEYDPDMDGDYLPNSDDPDIDGDGTFNGQDTDVDGDLVPNEFDRDVDGDGVPNEDDDDVDGDLLPNGDSYELDTDGDDIPDLRDSDADNDGIPDDEEDDPNGSLLGVLR